MSTTIPGELLYRTSVLIESFAQIPSAPSFLKDNLFRELPLVRATSSASSILKEVRS
jgi:hypothetical protein